MQDGDEDLKDEKSEWAERRTDWAEDRTILANERTFAGWMRTGMGSVAIALGLRAVFGAFDPTWFAQAVATVFLAVAVAIFWVARRNAAKTHERLDDHRSTPLGSRSFTMIASAMTVGTVATGVILWLL